MLWTFELAAPPGPLVRRYKTEARALAVPDPAAITQPLAARLLGDLSASQVPPRGSTACCSRRSQTQTDPCLCSGSSGQLRSNFAAFGETLSASHRHGQNFRRSMPQNSCVGSMSYEHARHSPEPQRVGESVEQYHGGPRPPWWVELGRHAASTALSERSEHACGLFRQNSGGVRITEVSPCQLPSCSLVEF